MEHLPIEPAEVELRNNRDFIASLGMIGEGGPIYEPYELYEEDGPAMKKGRERSDLGEEGLPRDYQ